MRAHVTLQTTIFSTLSVSVVGARTDTTAGLPCPRLSKTTKKDCLITSAAVSQPGWGKYRRNYHVSYLHIECTHASTVCRVTYQSKRPFALIHDGPRRKGVPYLRNLESCSRTSWTSEHPRNGTVQEKLSLLPPPCGSQSPSGMTYDLTTKLRRAPSS